MSFVDLRSHIKALELLNNSNVTAARYASKRICELEVEVKRLEDILSGTDVPVNEPKKSYVGTVDFRWSLITARNSLLFKERGLLFSCGWKETRRSAEAYEGWSHPDVRQGEQLSREIAIEVALGDLGVL